MRMNSFDDLLKHEVQELYAAERLFARRQTALAEAATDPDLRDALEGHVEVTQGQVGRLEEVARALGVSTSGAKAAAAEALLAEGERIVESGGDPMVVDAAIIAAAQKIEHYEIAGYGTLRALARRVGNREAERLLDETLAEERGADLLLTEIAEGGVNEEAAT